MTVFSGAVGWRGRPIGLGELAGCAEILDPYGVRRTWTGEAGGCAAALIVHDRPDSPSGLATSRDGCIAVAVDAHVHGREELASALGIDRGADEFS